MKELFQWYYLYHSIRRSYLFGQHHRVAAANYNSFTTLQNDDGPQRRWWERCRCGTEFSMHNRQSHCKPNMIVKCTHTHERIHQELIHTYMYIICKYIYIIAVHLKTWVPFSSQHIWILYIFSLFAVLHVRSMCRMSWCNGSTCRREKHGQTNQITWCYTSELYYTILWIGLDKWKWCLHETLSVGFIDLLYVFLFYFFSWLFRLSLSYDDDVDYYYYQNVDASKHIRPDGASRKQSGVRHNHVKYIPKMKSGQLEFDTKTYMRCILFELHIRAYLTLYTLHIYTIYISIYSTS